MKILLIFLYLDPSSVSYAVAATIAKMYSNNTSSSAGRDGTTLITTSTAQLMWTSLSKFSKPLTTLIKMHNIKMDLQVKKTA